MRDTDPMTTKHRQKPMTGTLADLRRAAGLSQTAVAARMGVNQSRVSQIEATYPNVTHASVIAYVEALGGQIEISGVGDIPVAAPLAADPDREETRASMARVSAKGAETLRRSAAKELPLEQRTADTSGDDPGRDVDQPDPEGHQSDREDRQEP